MKRYFISEGYKNHWVVWECHKDAPDCEAEPHKEFKSEEEAEDYITAKQDSGEEKTILTFKNS